MLAMKNRSWVVIFREVDAPEENQVMEDTGDRQSDKQLADVAHSGWQSA
jgi:hypothetical protein